MMTYDLPFRCLRMLLLGLDLEGARRVQRAMKLFLRMVVIACVHIGILFVVYGRKWLAYLPPMRGFSILLWLLLPSFAAFYLYYSSLSGAGIFTNSYRRWKLAACSAAATLFSLYLGVFFSLNTYGE
jgi:hypothetical protein